MERCCPIKTSSVNCSILIGFNFDNFVNSTQTNLLSSMRKLFLILFGFALFQSFSFSQCNGNESSPSLGNDTILCLGQTLAIGTPIFYDFYQWSTGSTNDSILVNTSGLYTLEAGYIGNNLILNGDFQGGTTAASNNFTSDYIPGTGGTYGLLSNGGQFAISTSPSLTHTNFSNCGDHTTGTGNMFIANGSWTPNTTVWTQAVNVIPGQDYIFSFWGMNVVNNPNISLLQLYVNGVPISDTMATSPTPCVWTQLNGTWNAGASTQAILRIVNHSVVASGNDFAIDDIYFAPICLVSDEISITYDPIQVNAGSDVVFCQNEIGEISASSNVAVQNYSWSNSSQGETILPAVSGIYTVTGTSLNGCADSDDIEVTIVPMDWDIDSIFVGSADCGANNGYVSVVTNGSFVGTPAYSWTGPGANSNNSIDASVWTDLSVGWYYLSIESQGCFRYDSVQVLPNNPPFAEINGNPLVGTYPLNVDFTNSSTNGVNYIWNYGNGNSEVFTDLSSTTQVYDTTGVYTVSLIVTSGNCSDTAYLTVIVTEPPVPPVIVPVSVEAPNVFTPNQDGNNEVYELILVNIKEVELIILDRWGIEVFNETSTSPAWDGQSISGVEMADGVYFYKYKAIGAQEELLEGHGFLHLVR